MRTYDRCAQRFDAKFDAYEDVRTGIYARRSSESRRFVFGEVMQAASPQTHTSYVVVCPFPAY
jgi:hypothetical protein